LEEGVDFLFVWGVVLVCLFCSWLEEMDFLEAYILLGIL
jgi:hypothetical protein